MYLKKFGFNIANLFKGKTVEYTGFSPQNSPKQKTGPQIFNLIPIVFFSNN